MTTERFVYSNYFV